MQHSKEFLDPDEDPDHPTLYHWKEGRIYLFIGPQVFIVGYSKAPEQLQSSTWPVCHSHAMTRTGREPATIRIAA